MLLAHVPPDNVRLSERKVRAGMKDVHQLFLIDRLAVCDGKDPFELWHDVLRFLLPFLHGDDVRDELHRAWTVRRYQKDQVFECGRTEIPKHLLHAGGLKLEHAGRVPLAEDLAEHAGIQRQVIRIDADTMRAPDGPDRVRDDVQVIEPQKVHLEKMEIMFRFHHIALYRPSFFAGVVVQRHQIRKRGAGSDDDAGGVDGCADDDTFQIHGPGHDRHGVCLSAERRL